MAREPRPDGTDELRVFTQLLEGRKGTVAAAVVMSLLSAAATLVLPLQVRDLVMALAEDERPVGPLLMMAGLAVGAGLAAALSSYLLARAGEGLVAEARFRVVSHILTLPLRRVRREGAGNLVARANSDSTQLRSVVDVGVAQIPSSLFLAVGTLIAMGMLDWVLLLVVVATFAVAGVGIFLCVRSIRSGVERQQNAIGTMSQQMTAAVLSLPTVKAFLAERQVASTLGHSVEDARGAAVSVARVTALVGPTMQFGQQLSIIAVMVTSGARLASGDLGIGEFAAFIVYLLQLVAPLTLLVSGVARMQSGLAARERLNSVLTIAPESSGATSPVEPSPTAPAVEFDAVTYRDGGRTIIHEAAFAAPAQGLTAIVGPSGAGKTTLLGLTERFLLPDSGRISVCGLPVEQWPLHQLRGEINYVDQSFTLVEGTVRQNLQLGQDHEPARRGAVAGTGDAGAARRRGSAAGRSGHRAGTGRGPVGRPAAAAGGRPSPAAGHTHRHLRRTDVPARQRERGTAAGTDAHPRRRARGDRGRAPHLHGAGRRSDRGRGRGTHRRPRYARGVADAFRALPGAGARSVAARRPGQEGGRRRPGGSRCPIGDRPCSGAR